MERKLATVQTIGSLAPIPGADLIEVASVKGWKLVVKKGEFMPGDKAVYCEIDSFLPVCDIFEFLRKSSYKKMGEQEGFRLKTMKLRGQVSQGLLLPLSVLPPDCARDEGTDVTGALGIVKYEPPIPASLSGIAKGMFPSFMPKTDEERIQNLADEYEDMKRHIYNVTEKLDGSSATFYFNNNEFGVCSRNLELLETPGNTFWKVARELDIENKLRAEGNYTLQGELTGEGIQGNPYRLKGQTVIFFNVFDIDRQEQLPFSRFRAFIHKLGLQHVPVLDEAFHLPATVDELLLMADGKSELNNAASREGLVIRSHDRQVSFKVISNSFLLKHE